MKRYRVLKHDLDTRATILQLAIEPSWDPVIRAQWDTAQAGIRESLIHQFGAQRYAVKCQNFIDLGAAPMSVLSYHNRFLGQARLAFVVESYYPALTGACALGERILNHLVLTLRDDFRGTPEYKAVHRKQAFDNWTTLIRVLTAWDVLAPGVEALFLKLATARHEAVHFRPELDTEVRGPALHALRLIAEIVGMQFGAFGMLPWFLPDTPGCAFIKKSLEDNPFIRHFYVPNCAHVSPHHTLTFTPLGWQVSEPDPAASPATLSDEEFARLFRLASGHETQSAGA